MGYVSKLIEFPPNQIVRSTMTCQTSLLNIKRPLKKARDNASLVETHPLVPNYTSRDQNKDNKSKDFFKEIKRIFRNKTKSRTPHHKNL